MAHSPSQAGDGGDGAAPQVETTDEFESLIETESRVLVDFYAEWCGPCQMMAPIIDELATESDASIVKVNVEELPQIAARYEVNAIPVFVAFEDGAPTERLVGMQDKADLEAVIA